MRRSALPFALLLLVTEPSCSFKKCTVNDPCPSGASCDLSTGICAGESPQAGGCGRTAAVDSKANETLCLFLDDAYTSFLAGRESCALQSGATYVVRDPAFLQRCETQVAARCSASEQSMLFSLVDCLQQGPRCEPGNESLAGDSLASCRKLATLSTACQQCCLR